MMVHPNHMMMHPYMMEPRGPLEQKTGLLFGFLRSKGFRFLMIAVGIFIVYMLVCALVTREGEWYLCKPYESIIKYIWPEWEQKVDKKQAVDIIIKRLSDDTHINGLKKEDKASLLGLIKDKLLASTSDPLPFTEDLSKLKKEAADNIKSAAENYYHAAIGGDSDLMTKISELSGLQSTDIEPRVVSSLSALKRADAYLAEKISSDAILRVFPLFSGINETTKLWMEGTFLSVVASAFFWLYGSPKRFYLTPLLTIASAYLMSSEIEIKNSENLNSIGKFAKENPSVTLAMVMAICTMITNVAGGSDVKGAFKDAMGTMATSLNDEVDWRRKEQRYRQMQKAQIETSAPFVALDYMSNTVAPVAVDYFTGLGGYAASAAMNGAKKFIGL